MSSDTGLYVVIPVLNRWAQTARCLKSLLTSGLAADRIIVIDHGSTDGTAENLDRSFPGVIRLVDDPHHWWAGAVNSGIRYALSCGASSVMLLNNDCRFEPHVLERLDSHAAGHPEAVIAPVQRDTAGHIRVVRASTMLALGFPTFVAPWNRRILPDQTLVGTRLIVGGRGAIVPRAVFETVGVFNDAALPHYGADHDFYLRCRRQGVVLLVATDCTVTVDDAGATSGRALGTMTWREFRESLVSRRSHRNIADVAAFFRLHYPLPGLYWLGTALFLGRYIVGYLVARLIVRAAVRP